MSIYSWARRSKNGYEVSSVGERRFSALNAKLADGRTLEMHYQLDSWPRGKGYNPYGTNWTLGKGRNPVDPTVTRDQLWQAYLNLWREHFNLFPNKLVDLRDTLEHLGICVLTDQFALTPINQAHAIATLLNEMPENQERVVYIGIKNSHHQKDWPDPRCIYGGRGSLLGNPVPMEDKTDRDRVCDEYEAWFNKNKNSNEELILGLGYAESIARNGVLYMRCFCAPKRCHLDTVKKHLFSKLVEDQFIILDEDPSITPISTAAKP